MPSESDVLLESLHESAAFCADQLADLFLQSAGDHMRTALEKDCDQQTGMAAGLILAATTARAMAESLRAGDPEASAPLLKLVEDGP